MVDVIELFKEAMQSTGLNPPDTIQPGKFQRFPGIDKKRGDDAGWCKLFDDGRGGVFGDFSAGLDEHWQCDSERTYSDEERQAFRQRCEAERKARDDEQRQQHEATASKVAEILAAAVGDPAQHPYALKKAVFLCAKVKRGAWPQRGWADALLIPIYGADGKVWTLDPRVVPGLNIACENVHVDITRQFQARIDALNVVSEHHPADGGRNEAHAPAHTGDLRVGHPSIARRKIDGARHEPLDALAASNDVIIDADLFGSPRSIA